jgi:transposase-like protein
MYCPYCKSKNIELKKYYYICKNCGLAFYYHEAETKRYTIKANLRNRQKQLYNDLQKEDYKPITEDDIFDEMIDIEFHNREARKGIKKTKK